LDETVICDNKDGSFFLKDESFVKLFEKVKEVWCVKVKIDNRIDKIRWLDKMIR